MQYRHRLSIAGVLLIGPLLPMSALALDAPKERPILTISGKISAKNTSDTARFDMKMLEALPQHSLTTSTPWFDKPMKFTGPLLADVLAAVKARGTTVHAFAINDYNISIPITDTAKYPIIMARLINDKAISVREKGPLFVIYPFDSHAELRTSTYYERSIWQLKAMEIK
ncbi:hypothetical protein LPB72_14635 [Hydrogenophaga crassostreae]|uniref:Oxidoreductase molybdopterin-binding domain-containing protein n=1 Tax=Hydrogenophaga crassostreae TaxID=1763535 RepID=A0A163CC68_9BURK|nr:hypothetical protein [Hydrogenophaga crassostreae]AOW12201.1 hypothetical protein LPB072_04385 [Hydrogenophaga crassostreae]OAD41146.1 hypothetical protein LPB72_14635 [Hydrogenophaga crassostreae]